MQQDQMNRLAAAGMAAAQLSAIQRADFACRLLVQLLGRLYEDQAAQIECSSTARKKAAVLAVALADDLLDVLRVDPDAVRQKASSNFWDMGKDRAAGRVDDELYRGPGQADPQER